MPDIAMNSLQQFSSQSKQQISHQDAYFLGIFGHTRRRVNSPSFYEKMRYQLRRGATLGNDSVPNNSLEIQHEKHSTNLLCE